ncbi:hypothetical protein C8R44DRAFT_767410 [Mycena epipterygia]|nr:hypothetical protein C8R44DRAFT_767410 [Mycena epipterygia]
MADGGDSIFSPIALPSGRTLRNRLVKVALYEHLATLFGGPPSRFHLELYSKWSAYDWGIIFTGNVQVSSDHICLAWDLILPRTLSEESVKPHAGRQSPNILGGRFPFVPPLGPSSIRLGSSLKGHGMISDLLHRFMFQIPRAMSLTDINDVVDGFVRGAELAVRADYDDSNTRIDEYSCSSNHDLQLHRIVQGIRSTAPSDFILGIKIHAADYAAGEPSLALDHVRTIATWDAVDLLEISGGDYEKPDFLTTAASSSARQAIFASFADHALRAVESVPRTPLILLTGGLATRAQLHTALSAPHAHLLGLGRSAVLRPDLPQLLRDPGAPDKLFGAPPDLRVGGRFVLSRLPRIKLLGAGVAMAWYIIALRRLASTTSIKPDCTVSTMGVILWMCAWFGADFERPAFSFRVLAPAAAFSFFAGLLLLWHLL